MSFRERRYTAQDGLGLYYREYGDRAAPRTALLCLAGLTRNSKDFHTFATRLAGDRLVLCPDLRGRGRSDHDPDWRHYDPRVYLNDIVQLLTLADIHRVVVIGTSLGGLLAMGLGAVLPASLAGVVINDIGPDLPRTGLKHVIDYVGVDRPQPDWDTAKTMLKSLLPDLCFQTEELFDSMVRNTFREAEDGMLHFDWDVDLIRPTLRNRGQVPDLWLLFRGLRAIPALAFRGDRSALLSEECFARMGREHPGLRRVTVRDTGHAPSLSEPECVAAIDDFLDRL